MKKSVIPTRIINDPIFGPIKVWGGIVRQMSRRCDKCLRLMVTGERCEYCGTPKESPKDLEGAREENLDRCVLDWPVGSRRDGTLVQEETVESPPTVEGHTPEGSEVSGEGVQLEGLVADNICDNCGQQGMLQTSGSTLLAPHRFMRDGVFHRHDPNWHNQYIRCSNCRAEWSIRWKPICPAPECNYGEGKYEVVRKGNKD